MKVYEVFEPFGEQKSIKAYPVNNIAACVEPAKLREYEASLSNTISILKLLSKHTKIVEIACGYFVLSIEKIKTGSLRISVCSEIYGANVEEIIKKAEEEISRAERRRIELETELEEKEEAAFRYLANLLA